MLNEVKLPTWDECDERIKREGFAAPRLCRFIHDYEPASPDDKAWRNQLEEMLRQMLIVAHNEGYDLVRT